MDVFLNTGSFFSVPAAVADQLKLASHAQLKVLLYLLCHADVSLTAGEITRACGVTEREVEEALCFWQNARILSNTAQIPVTNVQTAAVQQPAALQQPAVPPREQPQEPRAAVPVSSSSFRLQPDEIAKRQKENAGISEMLACAEQYAKRPLNYTELNSLIWMHEYLGLAPEIVLILVAYCTESNQFHVRSMEHIAVNWAENGICTCALAEEDVQKRIAQRSYTGQMMRIFGMAKPPTASQQTIFNSWCALHMPPEMVHIAYDKMRDNLSIEASSMKQLKYMNGIIERWAAAGIFTPDGAAQEDIRHRSEAQAAANRQEKRTNSRPAAKAGVKTAQSSIDLEEAAKLFNQP